MIEDAGMTPFGIIKSVAAQSLASQVERPGDYQKGGILICGKCGEPRQMFKSFRNPIHGDPQHQSTIKVVVMCKCEREEEEQKKKLRKEAKEFEKNRLLRSASLMDDLFANATFDRFRQNEQNARNFKLCRRFAERFDVMLEKRQGLLFWGGVGTGKSFAAACIANYLLERKVSVIMTSFVKLLEELSRRGGNEEILSRFNSAKLVILDDLGAERDTDYALEKVYNVIDSRYRNGLPVIITTNLSIDDMKDEEDVRYSRIYDRIFEMCYPMQFTGRSWRKGMASKRFCDVEKILLDDEGA